MHKLPSKTKPEIDTLSFAEGIKKVNPPPQIECLTSCFDSRSLNILSNRVRNGLVCCTAYKPPLARIDDGGPTPGLFWWAECACVWEVQYLQPECARHVVSWGFPNISKIDLDDRKDPIEPFSQKRIARWCFNVGPKLSFRTVLGLLCHTLGGAPELPSIDSQHKCEKGKGNRRYNYPPLMRRLIVLLLGVGLGGWVSVVGWDNFYDKRRRFGAALICIGTVLTALGLSLWVLVLFPSTWGWYL